MKSLLASLCFTLTIFSCTSSREVVKTYYFVEPFKEQEIKFFLSSDSSFKFQDATGCNQFEYTGKYRAMGNSPSSFLLIDSVRLRYGSSQLNSSLIFSIQNADTVWIINEERVMFHRQPFKFTNKKAIDLQEIRFQGLKEYYMNYLGRDGFIKAFGNGKSMKEARRRLLKCDLPHLRFRYP